jgi:hypothetical protein
MTKGDMFATGITIASGLAIAYVLQMHKEGQEVIPSSVIQELKKFDCEEMVQGLIKYEKSIKFEVSNDLKQLSQLSTSYEKKRYIESKTLEILGLKDTELNMMIVDSLLGVAIDPLIDAFPTVSNHYDDMRMDTLRETWDFVYGFKDGVIGVTGGDSKSFLCNSNISNVDTVFYYNYQ